MIRSKIPPRYRLLALRVGVLCLAWQFCEAAIDAVREELEAQAADDAAYLGLAEAHLAAMPASVIDPEPIAEAAPAVALEAEQ